MERTGEARWKSKKVQAFKRETQQIKALDGKIFLDLPTWHVEETVLDHRLESLRVHCKIGRQR